MNDTFLRACRGEPVDYTPVWLMRQAGRNIPVYLELHNKYGFLNLCQDPEMAAKITIMPYEHYGVDACVLFSDMPLAVMPMGAELYYDPVKGPIYPHPVRSGTDVAALTVPVAKEGLPFQIDTIRILKRELADKVPLIGFAGCPFTLGAYMVEGGVSQRYYWVKSMIYEAPEIFHALMEKITRYITDLLCTQVHAGANAVMLFESWGGVLTRREYLDFAYPYVRRVIAKLKLEAVPIIYFVDKGGALLEDIRDSGADVIQVDFRTDLDTAIRRLGPKVAVQGNLDPYILLAAPRELMRQRVAEILQMGRTAKGHVFNLGDGIQPETPLDHSRALVEAVHELSRDLSSGA